MDFSTWLLTMIPFLNLIPGAVFCYLPMKNQMKYTRLRVFLFCTGLFVLYVPAAAALSLYLNIDTNVILMPSLILFFLLYYKTIKTDLARSLAVYLNACAILSCPSIFAYIFDAHLHPFSGASDFSPEAGFFQFVISASLVLLLSFPLYRYFSWMLDSLDFPRVWYSTLGIPVIFMSANMMLIPYSYQTLYSGRILMLFPFMEALILLLLLFLYVLFYHVATVLLEHARQEEEIHFLEIQAEQYHALQNHIQQTRRLRHDFRHLVHAIAGLADSGDLECLKKQLREYQNELDLSMPLNYCGNAALNALFNYYREMADSEGIKTNWKIYIPEPLTISELDLCSLLGNLLENAIHGCGTVPQEQRFFSLSIMPETAGCLYIVATNSFDGTVRKYEKGYLSTKRKGDGMGLFSIKTIAEKYKGAAQIYNTDHEFFVNVMLKI